MKLKKASAIILATALALGGGLQDAAARATERRRTVRRICPYLSSRMTMSRQSTRE